MGLDQYAYAVLPHKDNTDFGWAWDDEVKPPQEGLEPVNDLAYWRKHPDLQGWMENLYLRKCEEQGVEPKMAADGSWFAGSVNFNCQPLRLTHQDLLDLREAVTNKDLPTTEGFFFGTSEDYHDEQTLTFITKALEALSQDMEIYYDSWW